MPAVTIIAIYAAIAICTGVVLGIIAVRGGGNFVKWLIYGALIPIVALPHAIIIITAGSKAKKCMYCRKKVSINATHCPKCGYEFIDWD
ncbi:MAG: hypothetical protein ACE5DW_04520 [Thermodesulfobacteriota bacterium]